ncbi:MAG TPA: hypothetical protein VI386_07985 [Candidatus Sulfotelmatobacter sp.]
MATQGITMKYERVHKVLGEGNFVLVASEGSFAGRATSFDDLFRVKNGKIAEHWDTIEAIAPRTDGRTRTVNSDYRIAAPECSVLEELASTRRVTEMAKRKTAVERRGSLAFRHGC